MDASIYEVTRDDYAGVVRQINTKTSDVETFHEEYGVVIKVKNKEGVHFTTRIIFNDGEEKYYVFNLPRGEDAIPPKPIRQVTLETKEEVQHFFEALSKLQQGAKDG